MKWGGAFAFAFAFDLLAPLGRPSGGSAQWVSRHGCRESRVGPRMARHGVPTERDRSEGRTQGQGLFAYFCGCLTKVSRRKGGTRKKPLYIKWICTLLMAELA